MPCFSGRTYCKAVCRFRKKPKPGFVLTNVTCPKPTSTFYCTYTRRLDLCVAKCNSQDVNLARNMNSVASKRLFQEYKQLTLTPPDGITAGPVNEDDLFLWEALIQGPEGTPYEGGVFPAELKFPKDYPLMPPTMKFQCDIWHPNGMYYSQHPPVLSIHRD